MTTHSFEQWQRMKRHFGGCVCCGTRFEYVEQGGDYYRRDDTLPPWDWETLVKVRILPARRGGTSAIENIQPLCRACNTQERRRRTDWRPAGWREALAASGRP